VRDIIEYTYQTAMLLSHWITNRAKIYLILS